VFRSRQRCPLARAQTDPEAFVEFYDAYADRVLRFVGSRVLDGEVALDLTSETFAKALERRQQFRGETEAAEQSWLFSIAASELSHFWRRGRVEAAARHQLGITLPSLTDADLERIEERAGVQAVAGQLQLHLDQLPGDQREAIDLRVIKDLSYAEIAQRAQISPQVARARVSRGIRALGRALAGEGLRPEDLL
jgi:RNA polymerase sigma factor (sigma-70 family)